LLSSDQTLVRTTPAWRFRHFWEIHVPTSEYLIDM
jgi:hypothetical protein